MTALDQVLIFLHHAPALFPACNHPLLLRLHLPLPHHNEPIACIYSQGRFLISGTDILRILLFRFRCLARPLLSLKKFEEGIFSDLRNLKPGDGARLEPARSALLDALYRFGCVRTQKRQKVFYWEHVDHDRLFRDAWERESRREHDAVDSFQAQHPDAFLRDPSAPLAPLDDATVDTAAVWHQTRPLLLTYVRAVEDPIERPLNADAVACSLDNPDSTNPLGLQRFRSASNGSGKEEDRCGGLIARRRAAIVRSRAHTHTQPATPKPNTRRSTADSSVQPIMVDPFDEWDVIDQMPESHCTLESMDPAVAMSTLFADVHPTVSLHKQPVRRGDVNRALLMAELEAFLTPPSEQRLLDASTTSYPSSDHHALSISTDAMERYRRMSSPTIQVAEQEPEAFPDVPSPTTLALLAQLSASIHSISPNATPIPNTTGMPSQHAKEHALPALDTFMGGAHQSMPAGQKRARGHTLLALDEAQDAIKRLRTSYF